MGQYPASTPTLGKVSGLRPVNRNPPGVHPTVSISRDKSALNHSNVAESHAPD